MVSGLSLSQVTYDPRTGRYRSSFGGFLSAADMKTIVRTERNRLETKLLTRANQLINGKDLGDWQRAIAFELKLSVLQATQLGAGGRERTTQTHYGLAGSELRRQNQFLAKFGQAISNGELSEAQIKQRAKAYANTIEIAYNQAEKLTREREGFNLAERRLDPNADHCPQCPGYETNGPVPIDQIVPVGVACDCGGNCQCTIVYRRSPR